MNKRQAKWMAGRQARAEKSFWKHWFSGGVWPETRAERIYIGVDLCKKGEKDFTTCWIPEGGEAHE